MNWLQTTWLMIAAACLTLAAIHVQVWLRGRDAGANAAFALLCLTVAASAFIELSMFRAPDLVAYGRWLWWYQLPIWTGFLGVVFFVRRYLRAGVAWLGWTALGLRTLVLAVNAFSTPSINFRELLTLERITVFDAPVAVVSGVANPWLVLAHVSLLVLLAFVFSATLQLWRRGDRRLAATIGGSLVIFIGGSTALAIGYYWGLWRFPTFMTPLFLPIVAAMGYELGRDLLRSASMAQDLLAKDAALRGSERKLALAAEAASAGLWSVERDTGKVWATDRALSLHGLGAGSMHSVVDVLRTIHPDDRPRVRAFIEESAGGEGRAAIEYRVVGSDGEVRWVASRGGMPEGGAHGSLRLMGATIDISDRKRAEDEVARQRVELEHLSRVASLSELSGALAHELNQPLAIIMSNAEAAQQLLLQPVPDMTELRAILTDIVAADERAGEVIRRLRGLLKRGAPNRQPLPLNDVVQDVLQFMRGDLIRRGVGVDTTLSDEVGRIGLDRVPFEQVLINVIGNACDAMAATAPGDRRLAITTAVVADMAEVRISDRGSGLPPRAEQVFEPFYTTKATGLGLGLAISRSIVTAHGGRLSAHANEDGGATFCIAVPLESGAR